MRLKELESLRGIAAVLVILVHIPKWNDFLSADAFKNMYLMVNFFFVLSGFVIAYAYLDKIKSAGQFSKFMFLRLGRLYPVHALFLVFFAAMDLAKMVLSSPTHLLPNLADSQAQTFFQALGEQLLLLQAVLPNGHPLSFNGPAWSISVEFYTYAIFGLLVLLPGRMTSLRFLLTTAAAVYIYNKFPSFNLWAQCLVGFFSGVLTLIFVKGLKQPPKPLTKLAIPAFFLFFLFVLIKTPYQNDWIIYPLSATLIISTVFSNSNLLISLLNTQTLLTAGKLSYSIYMSHLFAIWIISFVLSKILHTTTLTSIECIATIGALYSLIILTSQVVYKYVEAPMRRYSRRLVGAPTP